MNRHSDCAAFTRENVTKFEELLNNERHKYTSRVFHDNHFYIGK